MEYDTFLKYIDCIRILQSRELLDSITAASFPHNKNSESLHRKLHKNAYPDLWNNKKPLALEDVARIIKNGGR